jgi:hypothetical protein
MSTTFYCLQRPARRHDEIRGAHRESALFYSSLPALRLAQLATAAFVHRAGRVGPLFEERAKMSAAGRGKAKSPEHRAKMSAAAKARWARSKDSSAQQLVLEGVVP